VSVELSLVQGRGICSQERTWLGPGFIIWGFVGLLIVVNFLLFLLGHHFLTCDSTHRFPYLVIFSNLVPCFQITAAHDRKSATDSTEIGMPVHHPGLLHVTCHGLTWSSSLRRFQHTVIIRFSNQWDHVTRLNQVSISHYSLLDFWIMSHIIILAESCFIRNRIILIMIKWALSLFTVHSSFYHLNIIFTHKINRILSNIILISIGLVLMLTLRIINISGTRTFYIKIMCVNIS